MVGDWSSIKSVGNPALNLSIIKFILQLVKSFFFRRQGMKKFGMILGVSPNMGIGYQNQLPWKLSQDLKHFKAVTLGSTIIMGKNTFQSIGSKPLPKRENIVISKTLKPSSLKEQNIDVYPSLQEAIKSRQESNNKIFVIGGKVLYEEAAANENCDTVYLTRVGRKCDADVFLDKNIFKPFKVAKTSRTFQENDTNFDYQLLYRGDQPPVDNHINSTSEEFQYLDMIRQIIDNGITKEDRTGVGTISTFGNMMRFRLDTSFPLLTTKKVFFRGVVEELLWFLKGQTNGNILLEKGVKIWEGNGSREYLDSIGLGHREENDLGPVYGFQWRHFGAKYQDYKSDYKGQGVDQVSDIIHQLRNNPDSRRIILSAWNPSDLKLMALPPCHVLAQFYVGDGKLNCMMYQRSCDFGLGVPFNIASYALLTYILAQQSGLGLGEFVHVLGDTHIYKNHIEQLQTQLKRVPYPFPLLKIKRKPESFEDYKYEDFELIGYQNHEKISMKMAV